MSISDVILNQYIMQQVQGRLQSVFAQICVQPSHLIMN